MSAGREEVATWDLRTGTCKQVFRVVGGSEPPGAATEDPMALAAADGAQAPAVGAERREGLRVEELNQPPLHLPGARALLPTGGGGLMTAGSDCAVRLWDPVRVEQSYVVCGQLPSAPGESPAPQPSVQYKAHTCKVRRSPAAQP
mmetsp:Transcript_48581/g.155455  ORF Transcript_48581/g.155455 Transcript_48581/m.155455 type:complete len:145 (+) Transcript_48581:935-1369(+)